jgi:hypothetical protein
MKKEKIMKRLQQHKSNWEVAPSKGCATYKAKKLPVIFLFCRFLAKLSCPVRTLKAIGASLRPFPFGVSAFNFDANYRKLQEIAKRALLEVGKGAF